ncbi:PEBP-like protein [Tothia fuscella]|uniref:PEBP-like protein n=1 Tax=Tothia fuscella TaxID=1048955 RepID=A0A9P4NLP7_9PEZI|nr:PEBP-like protein [Tothia fuscella]
MAQVARPLGICSRCLNHRSVSIVSSIRQFSAHDSHRDELTTESPPSSSNPPPPAREILDPKTVSTVSQEARLLKHQKLVPIGSRRRRAALVSASNIPFEQLPYQCFQEARKVLAANREEVIKKIEIQRARLERLKAQDMAVSGGERQKQTRVQSMEGELKRLKVLADINDPLVKKRFEDGLGDMNKPIYRHLADKKWRSYKRLITIQRVTTMSVIPDVLPSIDPTVEVNISFASHIIPPGDFVYSRRSEYAPTVRIQSFDKGEKLVTIVAIDSDVPDLEKNSFGYRCHGLWRDVVISPTKGVYSVRELPKENVVLPWLPPWANKGSPYHRISLFVLEQREGSETFKMLQAGKVSDRSAKGEGEAIASGESPTEIIEAATSVNDTVIPTESTVSETKTSEAAKTPEAAASERSEERSAILATIPKVERENFILRSYVTKNKLTPIGVTMFRSEWDEGTAGVMKRAGIEGAGLVFKREKALKLPEKYRRKDGARYRGFK